MVVITNTLGKLQLSLDSQHKGKRRVSLQLGEPVCCAVHRKPRIRRGVWLEEGPWFSSLKSILLSLALLSGSVSYHGDWPIRIWHLAQEIQEQADFPTAPTPISKRLSKTEFPGLLVHRCRMEHPIHEQESCLLSEHKHLPRLLSTSHCLHFKVCSSRIRYQCSL